MKYEENLKFYKYAPIKEKKNDNKPKRYSRNVNQ